jgi:hypothetical protein
MVCSAPPEFIGLTNFENILVDPNFQADVGHTLFFIAGYLPLVYVGRLVLALALLPQWLGPLGPRPGAPRRRRPGTERPASTDAWLDETIRSARQGRCVDWLNPPTDWPNGSANRPTPRQTLLTRDLP